MRCPKCDDDTHVIAWYSAESMLKKGVEAAFFLKKGFFDQLFSVKDAIFGTNLHFKCNKCDHVFKSSQGSLWEACARCKSRIGTVVSSTCCNTYFCKKCYINMWSIGVTTAQFLCTSCGKSRKVTASAEEISEAKNALNNL